MFRKLKKATHLLRNPVLARGLIFHNIAAAIEHLDVITYVRPKHLIDAGANRGQFALAALSVFPDIRIDCFEPLARPAAALEAWAKTASSNIRIHRMALGAQSGNAQFYVTSRDDSSSLFNPGKAQGEMGISVKAKIMVPTNRLENVIMSEGISRPCMLKIDVQGGELEVLKGIGRCANVIDWIYVEVSFIELYEHQPLFTEVYSYLTTIGYNLRGVANCHTDPMKGPTQADVLFCRSGFAVPGMRT
jgi:FkbM family methyltransferase